MKVYNELVRELDSEGGHYSSELSEVDLTDPEDAKVLVSDPSGDVLLHLGSASTGSGNYLDRVKLYHAHVAVWRQQFEKLDGNYPQVNRITIDLQSGADINAFAERWNKRLAEIDQAAANAAGRPVMPMRLRLVRQDRSQMDLDLQTVHILSYIAGAISLLAATFIIFSALAMGVSERQRSLAIWRRVEDLIDPILQALAYGDAVMVKGSKGVRLALLVDRIKQRFGVPA